MVRHLVIILCIKVNYFFCPYSELQDKLDQLLGEYDELKEDEEEEEYDDTIFGIIPNPLAKVHRDITKTVDSFFENIPLIG